MPAPSRSDAGIASQLIPGAVSSEGRNISVMMVEGSWGGRDGAGVEWEREKAKRSGPSGD